MAIKGSLKEASLADVCQLLALGQKTGCLSVSDRSRFGQIFFENGRISFATVVNRRDRLGDLLVRDGVLTHEQLGAMLEQQGREPDRRLGELLVARGFLTEESLERYIRQQIEDAIFHLFTWSQGTFYFEVDRVPEARELRVSINTEGVLLEGARRVDEWSLIEKKIPSLDLLFEADVERVRGAGVKLTREQEEILPLLDGTRTVQELVDATGFGEFEVGQALFGLLQAGFAHRVGRRAAAGTARSRDAEVAEQRNLGIAFYRTGMLDDSAEAFRRVLEIRPDDVASRFYLALIAVREGREREAIRRLRSLLGETGPRFGGFLALALALERLGRREDALLVLDEAEALRPGRPAVPLARARLRMAAGDLEAAREELDRYLARLAPGETPAAVYYHFATLLAALAGDLDRAGRLAREGIDAYPESAPLLLLTGAVAERRGDRDEAGLLYRRGSDEDPELVQAHKNLGDAAYQNGLHEEALAHYRRAVELDPELGDDVYAKLGNLYYKNGDVEEALHHWRRALELNPSNQVVRNNLEVVGHAPA